jgi:Ran GTPase-activating protein (RanGAP) involved in mRNA processing and transport
VGEPPPKKLKTNSVTVTVHGTADGVAEYSVSSVEELRGSLALSEKDDIFKSQCATCKTQDDPDFCGCPVTDADIRQGAEFTVLEKNHGAATAAFEPTTSVQGCNKPEDFTSSEFEKFLKSDRAADYNKFHLGGMQNISDKNFLQLETHSPGLKELDVSNCNLAGGTFDAMLGVLKAHSDTIEMLSIANNQLTATNVENLAADIGKMQALVSFDMSDTGINSKEASILAQVIEGMGSLARLDLSNNEIGHFARGNSQDDSNAAMTALGSSIKNNTTLKELYFAKNGIDAANIITFVAALDSAAFSKLDLSKNRLANEAAGAALCRMLTECTSLTELDVSDNQYYAVDTPCNGPGFATEIAAGLAQATSLSSLNLSQNNLFEKVKDAGAMPGLVDALKRGTKLTSLDISNNYMKAAQAVILFREIPSMESLSSVNLLHNTFGVEQAQALVEIKQSHPNLKTLCGFTLHETELDLSQQYLQAEDAILLSSDIPSMESLSSVNLLRNRFGVEQAKALVKIKQSKPTLKTLCGFTLHETELNLSQQFLRAEDAILLSSDIPFMRSLSKLDISDNYFHSIHNDSQGSEEFIEPIATMLKTNTSITELNISNNNLNANAARIFSEAIRDNGSLSKLIFNGGVNGYRGWKEGGRFTIDTTMTEADFSGKNLGLSGAQILGAFMSTKLFEAKGSLSNLHIGCNEIPEEQMRVFIAMDKFDVLCAVPIKELKANSITELDLAEKSLGVEGALVLSTYLKADASGSLSQLDLSGNSIGGTKGEPGVKAIAEALQVNKSITKINLASNNFDAECVNILANAIAAGRLKQLNISKNPLNAEGAKELAKAIGDSTSLQSLHISSNFIGTNQTAEIKRICTEKIITLTWDESEFLDQSGRKRTRHYG